MKQSLFFVLTFFLALPYGDAQLNRKDYMDILQTRVNPRLTNLLPVHPGQQQITQASTRSGTDLQLDSTVTYFNYDPSTTLDSLPLTRTEYTYPQPGTKVEWETYFDGAEWQPIQYTIILSDNQDRIVQASSMIYDTELEEYHLESRLEAFPHGDSPDLLDSFSVWEWDVTAGDWSLLLEHHFEYDDTDRLIGEWSNFNLFGDQILLRDAHSYDAEGDLVLTENYVTFDGIEFLAGRLVTTFENHLPVERMEEVFDGIGFISQGRTTFLHNVDGLLIEEVTFTWDEEKQTWKPILEHRMDYDMEQRIISFEKSEDMEGYWSHERFTYKYEQEKQLATESRYERFTPNDPWVLDTRTYYYYQGTSAIPGYPIGALPLHIWPNPTMGACSVTLQDNAELMVYDSAGNRVHVARGSGTLSLDLYALPAGMYQLTARQGDQLFIARLIKQ